MNVEHVRSVQKDYRDYSSVSVRMILVLFVLAYDYGGVGRNVLTSRADKLGTRYVYGV